MADMLSTDRIFALCEEEDLAFGACQGDEEEPAFLVIVIGRIGREHVGGNEWVGIGITVARRIAVDRIDARQDDGIKLKALGRVCGQDAHGVAGRELDPAVHLHVGGVWNNTVAYVDEVIEVLKKLLRAARWVGLRQALGHECQKLRELDKCGLVLCRIVQIG